MKGQSFFIRVILEHSNPVNDKKIVIFANIPILTELIDYELFCETATDEFQSQNIKKIDDKIC